jgi:signal transduction histidine kinase/CheY-like chemotaxis protein/ligand-binding sensor domain-containing protein
MRLPSHAPAAARYQAGVMFLLTLCFSLSLLAQDYVFDLQHIKVQDGLPNRRVFHVTQDQEGFIWISSPGAISRYDGYQFTTYDASFLNISENNGSILAVDRDNYLWYCEQKGVENANYSGVIDTRRDTVYDLETFTHGLFSSQDVIHISQSRVNRSELLIATRQGVVYQYDGAFTELYRLPEKVRNFVISEALPDGSYWILHAQSMRRVKNGRQLDHFKVEPSGLFKIVANHPETIVETRNFAFLSKYWVLRNRQLMPFQPKPAPPSEITALFQVHRDYLCFATPEAIRIQDRAGNELLNYPVSKTLGKAENLKHFNGAFVDRHHTLWISSDNGLIRISQKPTPFRIRQAGNSIRSIFRDEGGLWIGGYRQNIYERHAPRAEQIDIPSHPAITSFVRGKQGQLWAGTDGFLIMRYDPDQQEWTEYDFSSEGKRLFQLFPNPTTGRLWVGTSDGLAYLNPQGEQLTPFELPIGSRSTLIRQFYPNAAGIWIVSNKGLFLMDSRTEVILRHYSEADGLPTDNLNHLYEDADGVFWLASRGGGLIRWDRAQHTFRQFTRRDGLIDPTIYAVYEDDFANLWLPSNHGLMRFNKHAKDVQVYLPQHGLAHEEFNTFAHFQAEDGTLYFGGLNGLTQFHPRDVIQEQDYATPLHLTRLRVLENNAEDFVDHLEAYRTEQRVRLKPGSQILELEVSLLDYESQAAKQYAYQIEGFQNQWIHTEENTISIINLPYGRYTVRVKGRGATGVWSDHLLNIPVWVQKPFYWQWWFILATIALGAGTVTAAVRWRVNRLKKDRAWLEAEVGARTRQIEADKQTIAAQAAALQELDQAKNRFFSNITHEFRTPLTLVIAPLEQVRTDPSLPPILRQPIQGALNNARRILTLINQLLDLSKIENQVMKVEAARGDLIAYTRELVQQFRVLAQNKSLRLHFTSDRDHWETHFDQDKWDKVVYNLLSNAIKFTPPGNVIRLSVKQVDKDGKEWIQLVVKDNGIGIESHQLERIFERFYQPDDSLTRQRGGTGIGLAIVKEIVALQGGSVSVASQRGEGTSFHILLPTLPAANSRPLADIPELAALPHPTPPEPQSTRRAAATSRRRKDRLELLIVEDNPEMRAYIRRCLGEDRYRITEAADGQQGIEKAQGLIPDLIISDVMMPKQDGFAVTRAIRRNVRTSHIPLVLLTAKTTLESRLTGLQRGADAYLTKPFSPRELVLRTEKLIEIRRLLQQRYQSGSPPAEADTYGQEDAFISTLHNYVLAHIDETDLSGDRIGQHFGMSRIHLYRKLKALTDQSITEFVKAVRLQKAYELLQQGQGNVSEVAYQTGFSSLSHFSRSFKQAYGITPSQV